MATEWLDQFESLDVIGNGSFGVIRKVRRKADGAIFARKDLNFSLMSERDKRQIVAEVNILKDLNHEHIVRYHDRMVDRDAGTLHILMEFCGGGDLSSLIKRAARDAERAGLPPRGLDEDKVWHILMQLLRALVYCHHPPKTGNATSTGSLHRSPSAGGDTETKRAQILHRDIKPDNVFLDEQDNIKLGDFGLSKALLEQASFASTYVGTPYYMSPELMQEKSYDTKSDIWSLGCLVYELCALKPPFHEARTHAELAALIQNGRIPPLPKCYSSNLFGVIKQMLHLNPSARPSALHLITHERIDISIKFDEISKAIAGIKTHKEGVIQRERAIHAREQALLNREADVQVLQNSLSHTQEQLELARTHIVQLQAALHEVQSRSSSPAAGELAAALAARDAEYAERAAVRDAEVVAAWEAREAELQEAVRVREVAMEAARAAKETEIIATMTADLEARVAAANAREQEFADAWQRRESEIYQRWQEMDAENQARAKAREHEVTKAWEERQADMEVEFNDRLKEALQRVREELRKKPSLADESFEEWHSIADISSATDDSDADGANVTITSNHTADEDTPKLNYAKSALATAMYKTPINANAGRSVPRFLKTPLPALSKGVFEASSPPSHADPPLFAHTRTISAAITVPGSAMRGVVMTTSGQPLVTPAPADILRRLARPLRAKTLDFGHIKEDAAEVEDALTCNVEDATPQPMEKRASIAGVSALRPKPSKDRVEVAPLLRRAKTTAPSSTSARAGPSSPRKARERSVSPNPTYDRASRATAELRRSPSTTDVKKPERLMVRTTTAPPVTTTSSIRGGRPSASGLLKKPREQGSALSPRATKPEAPVSSSSSSSVQPSGLSASDSSATSTEPDTGDTAVPSSQDKVASRRSRRNAVISPVPEEAPVYDLDDEENLPSPFLKRIDRDRFAAATSGGSGTTASSRAKIAPSNSLQPAPTITTKAKPASVGTAAGRRLSGATLLRVVAAKNATRAPSPARLAEDVPPVKADVRAERPPVASARRAPDEARSRPQRV